MMSILEFLRFQVHRLRGLRHADRIRDEIADEMRFHMDQRAADEARRGLPDDAARRHARRRFGHFASLKDTAYDVRGAGWIETTVQDLSFALRSLRQHPLFALTAVLTLAVGVGASSAMLNIIDQIVLRPLPFPAADRLVAIRTQLSRGDPAPLSAPEFDDITSEARSFAAVGAAIPHFSQVWTGNGEPRTVWCAAVSPRFFETLGVRPFMGRVFTPAEIHLDGVYAIVSYNFWQTQLGGDPHVLGRTLDLGGATETVIGVMPEVSGAFAQVDVWQTLVPDFEFMKWRENRFLTVIGRLRSGMNGAMAQDELTSILRRGPGESPRRSIALVPLKDDVVGSVRAPLFLLTTAVLVVLIVCCVNVSTMLLARLSLRRMELAVRVSLGAGSLRLMRQLATENILLVSVSLIIGTVTAGVVTRVVSRMAAGAVPRATELAFGGSAAVWAGAVAFALVVALSWVGLYGLRQVELNSTLRAGRFGASERRGLRILVGAQGACAMALLVVALLLVRSFWLAQRVDAGFDPHRVITAWIRTTQKYATGAYFNEILRASASVPGADAAAVATCVPGSRADAAALAFRDRMVSASDATVADMCWISPDYFRAIGARINRGRFFERTDDANAPLVAIVSASLAARYWPGENAIGKELAVSDLGLGRTKPTTQQFRRVIGVVPDIKHESLDLPSLPMVYLPYHQDDTHRDYRLMFLFVRAHADAGGNASLARSIREQIRAVNPDQPVEGVSTMEQVLSHGLAGRRATLVVLVSFAAVAVGLCAIGLYGMMAYTLSQRSREFGVRIALGATRAGLLSMVVRDGMRLIGIGVVVGGIASLVIGHAMSAMLFGITSLDALTFVAATALLITVGVAASFVPAWRVASTDAVRALRS